MKVGDLVIWDTAKWVRQCENTIEDDGIEAVNLLIEKGTDSLGEYYTCLIGDERTVKRWTHVVELYYKVLNVS